MVTEDPDEETFLPVEDEVFEAGVSRRTVPSWLFPLADLLIVLLDHDCGERHPRAR